jgi:hypothetical protein
MFPEASLVRTEIDVSPHPSRTPQKHVRTALQLLSELDARLGGTGSVTRERYYLARLLAAARRQLWLAAASLDFGTEWSELGIQRSRVTRNRGWMTTIALKIVALGALAVALVLTCAWRYARAVLRVLLRS